MLQYLVPGLIFAWAFEHSGTLWTAILLHAVVNALSLGIILS
jgi:membrane protease YdiL (CAAX protease family)